MPLIYKILPEGEWRAAEAQRVFHGSAIDLKDGFIHFSAAHQVKETAARHFAGGRDLLLVGVEADELGLALKWEPSRGGELFPHLYGPLETARARSVEPLPFRDGRHTFPPGLA